MASSTALELRYLSEPDMVAAGVKDMAGCVDAMEEVLALLHDGDYRMGGADHNAHGIMVTFPDTSPFPNMPLNGPDRRFMAMPAYIGGSFDSVGVKWYGSNPANREIGLPRSIHTIVLNDKTTSAPIAVMNGNLVSAYRTGAIPSVGVRHLARQDARVVGIIGPGVMNRTALEGYLTVRPTIDTVQVHGRRRVTAERYADYVREHFPQVKHITIAETIEEAVRGADIVSSATTGARGVANYPFIASEWIKPGALLCVPANLELEDELLISGARLFVDHYGLYESWASEFPVPRLHEYIGIIGTKFLDLVREGAIAREAVTDLGEVIKGERPGRVSEDEILVLSVGGMPVEDMAWGRRVLDQARARGIGTVLPVWDTPELS